MSLLSDDQLDLLVKATKANRNGDSSALLARLCDALHTARACISSLSHAQSVQEAEQTLLQAFRALRNACTDTAACDSLVGAGLVEAVGSLLEAASLTAQPISGQLPLVAAQLLANAATTSRAAAAAMWQLLFPRHFTILANIGGEFAHAL
jgi:hypothetical protein